MSCTRVGLRCVDVIVIPEESHEIVQFILNNVRVLYGAVSGKTKRASTYIKSKTINQNEKQK